MKRYVLTIDQSTTSTKVFLMDKDGSIKAQKSKQHRQLYPKNGWVEHDPLEIYENLLEVVRLLISEEQINSKDILSIAITNQRETTIVWDKQTGQPVHHAIVWQCRRTSSMCTALQDYEDCIMKKTGLKLDPYFSATKIRWILDTYGYHKDMVFGTMDSWLLYNLTKKQVHACDVTNASRTCLMNVTSLSWDKELCDIFQVPIEMLPVIKDCDHCFGYSDIQGILDDEIPIHCMIGDSQAALYAQQCIQGESKVTIGTGSSIMMNTGSDCSIVKGIVSTVGWKTNNLVTYGKEAIINCSGDTLNWLKNEVQLFQKEEELNTIFDEVSDNGGVYLVPAFVGLSVPHWENEAKASICGLSRNSNRLHILRAGLESIVYQVYDSIMALEKASGIKVSTLRVDGGASMNHALMQFMADITDCKIEVTTQSNLSAMGAFDIAIAASTKNISKRKRKNKFFHPKMKQELREANINGWENSIKGVLHMIPNKESQG